MYISIGTVDALYSPLERFTMNTCFVFRANQDIQDRKDFRENKDLKEPWGRQVILEEWDRLV